MTRPSPRWIRNGSVRLAVREFGDREGSPLLALHGFPECGLTWDLIADGMAAAGRTIVAPDLRGHGISDAPRATRAYRVERLLDDVQRVIEDLDVGPVDVLAHDWGGALAWLFAERRPQFIASATILNVPHPGVLRHALFTDPDQRKRSHYILKMLVPVIPERRLGRDRAAMLAGLFPPEHHPADLIEEYRSNWARPGVLRGMLNWYRAAALDRSLRPPGRPIELPIKLVWGRNDPLFAPSVIEQSLSLGDQIQLVEVDCGHAPHRELPAEVVAEVLSP